MSNCTIPSITREDKTVSLIINRIRVSITTVEGDKNKLYRRVTISQVVNMINKINGKEESKIQDLPIDQRFFPVEIPIDMTIGSISEFVRSTVPIEFLDRQYVDLLLEYYKTLANGGSM